MPRSLALLLFLCAVPSLAQPITGGRIQSDHGDAMTGYEALTVEYPSTDVATCGWWNFVPPEVPYYTFCSIGPATSDPARPHAFLTFSREVRTAPLLRGIYENASVSPHNYFHWWAHPGLLIEIEGHGVAAAATGRFAVLDYATEVVNGALAPTRFSVYFEQHWSNQRPAVRGYFHWNYSPTVKVSLTSPAVTGGQKIRARVTLTKPAPPGGATVMLRSSSALAALSHTEVVIGEGKSFAEVDVQTAVARLTDDVLIYAEHDGVGHVAPLKVNSPYTALTEIVIDGRKYTTADPSSIFEAFSNSASLTSTRLPTSVTARGFGRDWHWRIDLDTHYANAPLRAGEYTNVQRLTDPSGARMSISRVEGSSSTDVCGDLPVRSFNVLEATYDELFNIAALESLAVDFRCSAADGSNAVSGHVYWNYVPPGSVPVIPPDPEPPRSPAKRRTVRH